MSLLLKPFTCNANLIMLIYTDASFQNLSCGGSQGAFFIMIYDLNLSLFHVITWSSKRIKRVVKSTLAAETLALIEGIDAGLFLNEVLFFLNSSKIPIYALVDTKQLIDASRSTKSVSEKR